MTDNERDKTLYEIYGMVQQMQGVLTGGNGGGICGDVKKLEADQNKFVTKFTMGAVVTTVSVCTTIIGLILSHFLK